MNDKKPVIKLRDVHELEKELVDNKARSFTTDLTPHELYLLQQSGFQPLGTAVGVIVYSMGLKGVFRSIMRAFSRGEMAEFSHLNELARDIAIERMQKKAELLGGTGVVGMKINTREYADFIEVVVTGTAVKNTGEAQQKEIVVGA